MREKLDGYGRSNPFFFFSSIKKQKYKTKDPLTKEIKFNSIYYSKVSIQNLGLKEMFIPRYSDIHPPPFVYSLGRRHANRTRKWNFTYFA